MVTLTTLSEFLATTQPCVARALSSGDPHDSLTATPAPRSLGVIAPFGLASSFGPGVEQLCAWTGIGSRIDLMLESARDGVAWRSCGFGERHLCSFCVPSGRGEGGKACILQLQ